MTKETVIRMYHRYRREDQADHEQAMWLTSESLKVPLDKVQYVIEDSGPLNPARCRHRGKLIAYVTDPKWDHVLFTYNVLLGKGLSHAQALKETQRMHQMSRREARNIIKLAPEVTCE